MSKSINLDQKLEYKGYWYLPSLPENKVAGILTYCPNEKIVLELIGSFDDSFSELFGNKEESVIYGKTSDAKEITLLQCFQYSSVNFNADFPIVRYNCNYMLIGKHINSLDERCQYRVRIRMPELTYWCHPGALTTTILFDKNDKKATQTSISFSTKIGSDDNIISEVRIDETTSIQIKKGVSYDGTILFLKPELEQYTYIDIIKQNETSIEELLGDICLYEQFISLATLNIVKSSDITLFDEKVYQQGENNKYYREIHLIHPFVERMNIDKQSKATNFLFQYSAIEELYPKIIKNWYNAPIELYPIRSHLINSLEKKAFYNSVDFMIIMQAVEGFWWRFRDESYHTRNSIPKTKNTFIGTILNELLAEFNDVSLLKKCEINIEAIVDSRHYYSHFLPLSKRPNKLEGWPLMKQAKYLRVLLICCVLSFIGFENSQINTIFEKSNSKLM